jgi:hypothetical protein
LAGAAFSGVGVLAPVVRRSEVVVVGITALALIADAEGLGDVSISPHVSGVGRRRLVPLMRTDSFEVGEHDASVECVMVVKSGVLDHGVRDGVFVLADELATTARARLFVGHGSHPFSAVGAFERDVDEMDRRRQHFVVVLLGVRGVLIQSEVDGHRLDDDAIFASEDAAAGRRRNDLSLPRQPTRRSPHPHRPTPRSPTRSSTDRCRNRRVSALADTLPAVPLAKAAGSWTSYSS